MSRSEAQVSSFEAQGCRSVAYFCGAVVKVSGSEVQVPRLEVGVLPSMFGFCGSEVETSTSGVRTWCSEDDISDSGIGR